MVQQHQHQRDRQPVAGPSSLPPRAPRSSQVQQQSHRGSHPDRADFSGYGYGKHSEFGSSAAANGGPRRKTGNEFTNGHGGLYASSSSSNGYPNHHFAVSAPLPPAGSPMPPQGLHATPPTGPKSLKLQPQSIRRPATRPDPGPSSARVLSSSGSYTPSPPSTLSSGPPPPAPSGLPPPEAPSSSSSSSARPASSTSIPPKGPAIPSAPRAMLARPLTNPLKGKGPAISVPLENGSATAASAESLARAAFAKTASSSSTTSTIQISTNGTTKKPVKSMKIDFPGKNITSKPLTKPAAFAVVGFKAQAPVKPKRVNVLELEDEKREQIRRAEAEEAAAKQAQEKAEAEARATRDGARDPTDDEGRTQPRYTPPPRTRPSRWEPADVPVSHDIQKRSHTPPPRCSPTPADRGYTPPPRSRPSNALLSDRDQQQPSSSCNELSQQAEKSYTAPAPPRRRSFTPPRDIPPPPPPQSTLPPPPPSLAQASPDPPPAPLPDNTPPPPPPPSQDTLPPPPPAFEKPPPPPQMQASQTPAFGIKLDDAAKPTQTSISFSLAQPLRPRADTVKVHNPLADEPIPITKPSQEKSPEIRPKAPVDVQAAQGQAVAVELTSEPNADAEMNAAQPLPEKADTRPKEPNFLLVPIVQSKEDSETSKQSKKFHRREHGKGIEKPVQDPRNGQDNYNKHLAGLIGRGKVPFHYRLEPVSLPYNEYSCGPPPPPPPSAILVTNLSRLVTAAKIQAHFSQYGAIQESDYKTDPATGGFLGICWVKYEDSTKRNIYDGSGQMRTTGTEGGQDGNLCAREAAKRNNGHKHPILAGKDDKLRVLVDGEGIFCARMVKEALDLKYGRLKPKMSSDARLKKPEPPLVPHKSLPSRPRTERSPEPAYESDASRSRRPPTQSRRDDSDHRLKGDSYRPRTPPRGPSHARDYAQTSPPNTSGARAPYRLPTSTTRRSPERGRHGPKLSVSRPNDSDSDSANASENEENSRWKDDDRVYGVDSRLPRRQAPVATVKAVLLSEKDRLHISALRMLADQDYQYLVIEKGNVRAENFRITDHTIKSHLAGHQPKDIFQDTTCWYATFRKPRAAVSCYAAIASKTLAGAHLTLRVEQPPTLDHIDTLEREAQRRANLTAIQSANVSGVDVGVPNAAASHRKATFKQQTKQEVVLEARSIIIKELREAFKTDLRRRLAANFVRDAWVKHDANPSSLTKDVRSSPTKSVQAASNAQRASASQSSQASAQNVQEAHKLPSFGRQDHRGGLRGEESSFTDVRARSTTPAFIAKRPDDDAVEDMKAAVIESNQSKPVDDDDATGMRTVDVSKSTEQKKHTSDPKVRKKGKLAKKVEVLHFTSSEEDDSDRDDDVPLAQRNVKPEIIDAEARQITPESLKDDMVREFADPKPEEDPVHVIIPEPHEDQTPSEAVINLPTPAPSDSTTPSTKRELSDSVEEPAKRQRLLSYEVAEPDTVAVTDVSEPVEAVRPAARKAAPKGKGKGKRAAKPKKKASATPTPEVDPYSMIVDRLKEEDQEDLFYAKIAVKLRKARQPLPPLEPPEEGEDDDLQIIDPRHETGCARTEGYYKIPQPEKLRYLLARNQGKTESAKESSSSLSVSRLARANARHLASGLDKHKKATATDTDLLQLNQLRTRKKQLRFARSPIHDWGLYALEYIPAGEMVIEYVGEQIRQQVADKREKAYERQGIGSSYLFRVDDDVVIDATMKGNLGRLINHCCTPNCTAKILSVGNSKKIVIYAKQVINKGDEITYDYHFPIEDEKIVCLCGSSGCRGFLN